MRRLLAVWTFLLLVAAHAAAQFGSGFNLPTVEYNPLLLIDPKVQKELNLSPAVSKKLFTTLIEEGQKLLPALNSNAAQSPQQRTKAMNAQVSHMQTRLTAMLTPSQRARLHQLTLQSIGPVAVLQPKASAQLGLTAAQRTKLQNSFTVANQPLANAMARTRTTQDWQAQMARMGKVQATVNAASQKALVATLTAPQRAKWKAMQGKPFALSGFLGAGGLMGSMGG